MGRELPSARCPVDVQSRELSAKQPNSNSLDSILCHALQTGELKQAPEYSQSKADEGAGKPTDWLLAIFTLLLVAVGALQAYYLNGTLKVTASAATAAKVAAEHVPRVERAYIAPGANFVQGQNLVVFVMNNYGKTPAFIGTVTLRVAPEADLPDSPVYIGGQFGGHVLPTNPDHMNPFRTNVTCIWNGLPGQVVYGRVWYRDIFGACHSSGFILHASNGLPAVAGKDAYWEDRDERDLGLAARAT